MNQHEQGKTMIVKDTYKLQIKSMLLSKSLKQVATELGMSAEAIMTIALEAHEHDHLVFNKG